MNRVVPLSVSVTESGVSSLLLAALTSAPFSTNRVATVDSPINAAQWSAVVPS